MCHYYLDFSSFFCQKTHFTGKADHTTDELKDLILCLCVSSVFWPTTLFLLSYIQGTCFSNSILWVTQTTHEIISWAVNVAIKVRPTVIGRCSGNCCSLWKGWVCTAVKCDWGVIFVPSLPKRSSKEDYKMVSLYISVDPPIHHGWRCCNSTTIGPIRSISSCMDSSWSIDV